MWLIYGQHVFDLRTTCCWFTDNMWLIYWQHVDDLRTKSGLH